MAMVVLFSLSWIPAMAQDGGAFYEKRIRPLLIEHCAQCHGAPVSVFQSRVAQGRDKWQL